MIKAESNQGKMEVEMEGTVGEIIAETSAMLHCVYNALHEDTREMFAKEIHQNTAPGGLCWMTREQRRENMAKCCGSCWPRWRLWTKSPKAWACGLEGEPLKGHPDPVGEPGEPGVPVKADGDCSLEEMTRNAARMAMEKKEA